MALFFLWLLAMSPVQAETCDAAALLSRLNEASPAGVAPAFVELAACDEAKAKKAAAAAIPRMVAVPETPSALVAAIRLGEPGLVRSWIAAQEPDVRSQAITRIGRACPEVPAVSEFFVRAHAEIGGLFWEERWHRGLPECRDAAVQRLLTEALTGSDVGRTSRNRSGYFALLEVYARNLGVNAVPKLKELLATARDEEESVTLVTAFASAANVGGVEGQNAAATEAAVVALEEVAPTLTFKPVDRARTTMIALGRPERASLLARYGWPSLFVGGAYTYGVSAVEDITCRNGSKRAVLHHGSFTESGGLWPDELQAKIADRVKAQWPLTSASKCGGTAVITVSMSPLPVDAAGLKAWTEEAKTAFSAGFSEAKVWVVAEEGFGY
jgi:hypothetical protein